MKNYLGIDPGKTGAISQLSSDTTQVFDMPIYKTVTGKKKWFYDLSQIRALFLKLTYGQNSLVVLEKQQAFPGQGGVSNFSTGLGFGVFQGLLVGLGIPYEEVHPKTWQKIFYAGKSGDRKILSYQVASQLFPDLEFITPRGRKIDGRSDAILLAEYGRRIIK